MRSAKAWRQKSCLTMDDSWTGRRVCVTGGSGFLGLHLVRLLQARGARVRTFGLPPRADHPLLQLRDVEHQFGDILDRAAVGRALADCDTVFHTAGLVAVWGPALARMHAVHVEGTQNVLMALAPGARLVHTSSVVAVGAARDGAARDSTVLDEDSAFNLQGLRVDYVHAKRAAEEIALGGAAAGRDVVIVNPGYLLGPEDHEGSVMGRFCLRVWKGRTVLAPPGGLNVVDVRDVALGHLQAATRGQAGRRYILGNENVSLRELVGRLSAVAGLRPRGLPRVPCWLMHCFAGISEVRGWWRGREPYPSFQHARMNRFSWHYRSDRARRELGYLPRPLAETLRDAYEWHFDQDPWRLRRFNRWWMRPGRAAA
jgi:dihydroflavonol-4-reductase